MNRSSLTEEINRAAVNDPRLRAEVERQPYPLIFATISGAHLYGFPSADSDFDLRGVHLLPAEEVVGLEPAQETVASSSLRDGAEIDLVTHDARKFFALLLQRNGYVLEQLYSPLVVRTSAAHEELCAIARGCITRQHAHHYLGFAASQWRLFTKEEPRRVKPLLYTFRVLLTGIYLMETGVVEASIVQLNERFRLPYIAELVARKLAGPEHATLDQTDVEVYEREYQRLVDDVVRARDRSTLPDIPAARAALNDLLVRLRLKTTRIA